MKRLYITVIFLIVTIIFSGCRAKTTDMSAHRSMVFTENELSVMNGTEYKTQERRESYIGNKKSKKFHLPDCYSLPYEKNRVMFSSREDAVSHNYEPCRNCNP